MQSEGNHKEPHERYVRIHSHDQTKMFTLKRENNKFVTMQWNQANLVFENMILNDLILNYNKVIFNAKIHQDK